MSTVAEYLRTLPTVEWATDCEVRIGRTTYTGAIYSTTVTAPAHSRAALEHRMPSTETRFYLLGERPPSSVDRNTVYRIIGEHPFDWFVAGWADARVANDPRYREFHRLGVWFGLHCWTHTEPIDRYESAPYRRMDIEVTYHAE